MSPPETPKDVQELVEAIYARSPVFPISERPSVAELMAQAVMADRLARPHPAPATDGESKRLRAELSDLSNDVQAAEAELALVKKERDAFAKANARQASCIHQCAQATDPEASASIEGTPRRVRDVVARLNAAMARAEAAEAALAARPAVEHNRAIKEAREDRWQPMETAPTNGRHCIFAVPVPGGFIYSAQGAYQDSKWNSCIGNDVKPLAWMPNVLLPDHLRPADRQRARNGQSGGGA